MKIFLCFLKLSGRIIVVTQLALMFGCAGLPIDQIELMPAPDVYGDGLINPLPETNPRELLPYDGILYATDRKPAGEGDPESYYVNDRGQLLRLGLAKVKTGKKEFTWEFARKVSMLQSRSEKYPIRITGVDEWGFLASSIPYWADVDIMFPGGPPVDATDRFMEAVNSQLEISKRKHVYIFVHGYKVVYENPVLVASELWHFLGYKGAFIAYSWPSTPSLFAYVKDSDTSNGYARNFRLLLEALAEKSDVEQIHIIGYSNGTRLVTRALEQLALKNHGKSEEEIYERLKLHNVILVGSDLDRGVFASYISDGMLKVPRHLTIYMSKYDKALGFSQFLTRRQRVGQMFGGEGGELSALGKKALVELKDRLSLINVTNAEGSSKGNGHGYFRSSPWASSDILMTLYYSLKPEDRGLVNEVGLPIYTFPDDFIQRLWLAIKKVDPEFAERFENLEKEETGN